MPHDYSRRLLTDTGPIVALLDRKDKNYDLCWEAMQSLPDEGLVTPTACLVEILYLLDKAGGRPLQRKLWKLVDSDILLLRPESISECIRASELMETYSDIPMDFADGLVVAIAESLKTEKIFTIDKHFYAYRTPSGGAFTVVPPRKL